MDEAKVRFSPTELGLLQNAGVILTKNEIIRKVHVLLASLIKEQQHALSSLTKKFPVLLTTTPKISKGEKYKDLPYLILDHPRLFEKENVFAIRTMFWWGNFFSTTIHLSGVYLEQCRKQLIHVFSMLRKHNVHASISDDAWQHDFEPGNYRLVRDMTASEFEGLVMNRSFIKLSIPRALKKMETMREKLLADYDLLTAMLATEK